MYYEIPRFWLMWSRVWFDKKIGFFSGLVWLESRDWIKGSQDPKICSTKVLPEHTVSFDWFLTGLEWILNLEFCLLKLLIFYQKLLWNIRSRLNSSTFWVFRSVFKWSILLRKWRFWSNIFKYRLKNSKCGRVKPRFDIP